MGFVLSVLYFVIYYITPATLFGPLAQFRIELLVAFVVGLMSVPRLFSASVTRTPQAIALLGLAAAVLLSMFIGMRWPGGAVDAMARFVPNIYAFFLVCLYCNSRKKLNVLVLMLMGVCLFVVLQGSLELRQARSPDESGETITGEIPNTVTLNSPIWNAEHPYLTAQQTAPFEWIFRIRGVGQINDPNDFGQLLICEIPLLFILWKPKRNLRNFAVVLVPASILLTGIFLTHSRGSLVALIAVIAVAARRKLGTVPSILLALALLGGAMALQFTGGRAISASAGEDRTALWGQSLQLLKTHPLFGIGMNQLADQIGLTAHNSIVVCVTELGLFGLFFWAMFLFQTARETLVVFARAKLSDPVVNKDKVEATTPFIAWRGPPLSKSEISHLGHCLLLSLTGFLTAGWFLSRSFVMTFFFLGGIVQVVYEAARRQGMVKPGLPFSRTLMYSAVLTVALVVLVYISLRILNLSN